MGLSITELLIILAIVLLLFGTKKLRNLGSDLGGAIKGFKGAMKEEGAAGDAQQEAIEGETEASAGETVARNEETADRSA